MWQKKQKKKTKICDQFKNLVILIIKTYTLPWLC